LLRTRETYEQSRADGLVYRETAEFATQAERAEMYPSAYASQLPGVKQSERAFVMEGNYLRSMFYDMWLERWQRRGLKITSRMRRDLAHVANILTGEGDVRWLSKHATTMSILFFSPRFLTSRAQIIHAALSPGRLSAPARKIIAHHLVSYVGGTLSLIGLLGLAYPKARVEKDPRSAGNTRIDFWAGYQPMLRYLVQFMLGQAKTRAGRVVPRRRGLTIRRFLQSKLAPITGLLADVMAGETFYGEAMSMETKSIANQFYQRLMPFFVQDVIDAMRYQGYTTGLFAMPLAFHGVGVQSYPLYPAAKTAITKDRIAREVLGTDWNALGPDVQKMLRLEFPIIGQLEREATATRESFEMIARAKKEQRAAGIEIVKALPMDVQDEMEKLAVTVGGLSRQVAGNWTLNDARYAEYKTKTRKLLQKVLPEIIRKRGWTNLSPIDRQTILETVIYQAKQAVRQDIISKAKVEDLRKIELWTTTKKSTKPSAETASKKS